MQTFKPGNSSTYLRPGLRSNFLINPLLLANKAFILKGYANE